ncbi:glycosyltransferase [Actinomycetospora cinnamomea]|uniref:Glycosyltransferase involved in cell wall biosynthesis n=1 Tax=Actinomycetospora cinnamomea TaxID=663609 RepID=A0A2U1F747_9PSEU|nr:glycosyltransferase [Actinomycetospora cinnamomea]PVZ07994.1 glycosyltransferase involved in cell wall biosynthesis [Actinomycetospora cinnamomea]
MSPLVPDRPIRLSLVLDIADGVGGAEFVLLNTFRHLDRRRVEPELVSLRDGGSMVPEFRGSDVAVHELHRGGRWDMRSVVRLWRHFRTHRPDVVLVAHFQRASLTLGRLVARLAGVPTQIVAVHDMGLTSVGLRCLPRHVVETLFLTDALALLGPSQREYLHAEEGVGRYPWRRAREFIVPNGVALPERPAVEQHEATRAEVRAEWGAGPDDVVLGVVARLTPQKAHEVLFRAVARLRAQHPNVRVVLAGDGPRREELAAIVEREGLPDVVRFLGERRDVPRLLAGFDVFALSSKHEGVPIAVIEAMAAELPVVAPGVGGLPDVVGDGSEGFVVAPGDDAALADRLARLVADPDLRTALGKNARRRAEHEFTIEATARAFEDMVAAVARR